MNRFILITSFFSLTTLLLFALLELPVQLNYQHQTWDMGDWNQLSGIDADIVILGNSRSWTTFDAPKMSSQTGKKVYVLAQDGWQANLLLLKLKHYLEQNKEPSILIFQVDQSFLSSRMTWYAKPQFAKFLFADRENLYNFFKDKEGFRAWEFFIPFVRYSGLPGVYLRDALAIPTKLNRKSGFHPRPVEPDKTLGPLPWESFDLRKMEVDYISKFRRLVPQARHIGIYPLVSYKCNQSLLHKEFIREQCLTSGVEFFDLNQFHPLQDSIFSDNVHVNEIGASISTRLLLDFLNETKN